MDDAWPVSRNYVLRSLALWAFFLASIALLAWGSATGVSKGILWLIASAQAGSVAAQFVMAHRLISSQDEFIRALTAKRIIAAAGLTITVTVLVGIASQFLGAPNVPAWLAYPLFWGSLGLVTPFVRSTQP